MESTIIDMQLNTSQEPAIPREDYEMIEGMISREESVVGIDAKKTHVIIIHKLRQIEKRLEKLEQKLK